MTPVEEELPLKQGLKLHPSKILFSRLAAG